ncbi:MAG: efflux RND transporter periplasmic adaptor subunit [Myxococcales bacterium]|nr:efflux RND transporter periplasmic adaptor subunit [Myxococcales bacterium]
MKPNPKLLLTLGALGAGVLGAMLLFATAPETPTAQPQPAIPLVRTIAAEARSVQLLVETHGTVAPRTESDIVPEISGRVLWVSPALVSGGFFEKGDPLLRIDPADYEVALERARAQVARAESEAARAERELERQETLAKQDVTSASRLDDARNAEKIASAARREARAALDQAERDVERTEIGAPYAGRVREEKVDVGQFVSRGVAVGRIYAVDWAEVRLPIRDDELAWIELPSGGLSQGELGPEVTLRARYAGAEREWQGRVVRTEGEIDARSRMVHVVARVEDPYGRGKRVGRPDFPVGLFVEAEILGKKADDVVVLPRTALRTGDRVLIVDAEDRLRFRAVDVMRRGREKALIRAGIEPGERVCISALETPVDGMHVRPIVAEGPVSVTGEAEEAPGVSS